MMVRLILDSFPEWKWPWKSDNGDEIRSYGLVIITTVEFCILVLWDIIYIEIANRVQYLITEPSDGPSSNSAKPSALMREQLDMLLKYVGG